MLPSNGQEATREEAAKYNLAVMPTYLYPADNETTFARFLHKNTAEEALQRLLVEIEENRHEPVPWVAILIFVLSGMVVAAVTTWLITYFVMRKRAKNAYRPATCAGIDAPTEDAPAVNDPASEATPDGAPDSTPTPPEETPSNTPTDNDNTVIHPLRKTIGENRRKYVQDEED